MLNLVEGHWLILYLKQCVRSLLPGFVECIHCVPTFIDLMRVFDCKTQKKENKSPWCVTNLDGSRHSYCSVFQISFLDYMAYLPLFLSIHQNICDNALDMSRNKYQRKDTTWPRVTLETICHAECIVTKRKLQLLTAWMQWIQECKDGVQEWAHKFRGVTRQNVVSSWQQANVCTFLSKSVHLCITFCKKKFAKIYSR